MFHVEHGGTSNATVSRGTRPRGHAWLASRCPQPLGPVPAIDFLVPLGVHSRGRFHRTEPKGLKGGWSSRGTQTLCRSLRPWSGGRSSGPIPRRPRRPRQPGTPVRGLRPRDGVRLFVWPAGPREQAEYLVSPPQSPAQEPLLPSRGRHTSGRSRVELRRTPTNGR